MLEFKRILLPLDGSDEAELALPVATSLAKKYDSTLLLLCMLDIPTPTAPTAHPEIQIDRVMTARKHALDEAEHYLNERQREIHDQGIRVRTLMCDHAPAEDIVDKAVAENVDLIVLACYGHGDLDRWTLSGIADKVIHHSPCLVVLV